jgi:hypothetical protein
MNRQQLADRGIEIVLEGAAQHKARNLENFINACIPQRVKHTCNYKDYWEPWRKISRHQFVLEKPFTPDQRHRKKK